MIALLKEETKYLLELLEKQSPWWIRDSLIDKVRSDQKEKEDRLVCDHTFGEYKGVKYCCKKCGGFASGMGTLWTFKKNIKQKDFEPPTYGKPEEPMLFD